MEVWHPLDKGGSGTARKEGKPVWKKVALLPLDAQIG